MKAGNRDEDIVRAFLEARVPFWETLPYDWMELSDEDLDELNLLDFSEEVEQAYKRSRSDPAQRQRFAKDYERFERSNAWAEKIVAEASR
jgi:hypothetical protein